MGYESSNDGYNTTHYSIYFNNRFMYKGMTIIKGIKKAYDQIIIVLYVLKMIYRVVKRICHLVVKLIWCLLKWIWLLVKSIYQLMYCRCLTA